MYKKTIVAEKVQDGYLATVQTVYHCRDFTELHNLVKLEGLEIVFNKFGKDCIEESKKIIAE